jgi:hypothetical protein
MSALRRYPNVTLTSMNGELSVVVYLPIGVQNDRDPTKRTDRDPYYYSSRFEHGSMIGSITRRRRRRRRRSTVSNRDDDWNDDDDPDEHILYGTDLWRMPHNTHWPESGVGLASEFGVGDDGALCDFRCGWPEAVGVTNGLLGYLEADNGDSFLKIGVGEIIKGTCPACDSTDDYRFNSPYLFAKEPVWNMTRGSDDLNAPVVMEHEARLRNHGYYLRKDIDLVNNVLSVTTTLKNLGDAPFSTVWYSHNFFTCDAVAVGPGYSIDLNIKGDSNHPLYEEPATWSWSKPLADYGKVRSYPNSVHVDMFRVPAPGERIKAEFANDQATLGGFTIDACETGIESRVESPALSRDDPDSPMLMYAYNMYVERTSFAPEPQFLINNLQPEASVSWTQVLIIHDNGFINRNGAELAGQRPMVVAANSVPMPWWNLRGIMHGTLPLASLSSDTASQSMGSGNSAAFCAAILFALMASVVTTAVRYRRRRNYQALY